MSNITLSIPKEMKRESEQLVWVNFSELSKEELQKKEIFEKYMQARAISDKDWRFCEQIDWHPVDWLPFKESFLEELQKREKGPFIKLRSVNEIFEK